MPPSGAKLTALPSPFFCQLSGYFIVKPVPSYSAILSDAGAGRLPSPAAAAPGRLRGGGIASNRFLASWNSGESLL